MALEKLCKPPPGRQMMIDNVINHRGVFRIPSNILDGAFNG